MYVLLSAQSLREDGARRAWAADFTSFSDRSIPAASFFPTSRTRIEAKTSQSEDIAAPGGCTERAMQGRNFPWGGHPRSLGGGMIIFEAHPS
jgi:hypothetical protein